MVSALALQAPLAAQNLLAGMYACIAFTEKKLGLPLLAGEKEDEMRRKKEQLRREYLLGHLHHLQGDYRLHLA